jgi:hypothetical protein
VSGRTTSPCPPTRVAGKNYDVVHGFARTLSVAPRGYGFWRDDVDYVVFCFLKPEDAEVFLERFGGERVRPDSGAVLN